jgi:hypothetical protein
MTTTATASDTILAIDLSKYRCVADAAEEREIGVREIGVRSIFHHKEC